MKHVVEALNDELLEVRKEAIWVLGHIVKRGAAAQVLSVVELGAIDALCRILDKNDPEILSVALWATHDNLKFGVDNGKDYTSNVDLERIKELQKHDDEDVKNPAVEIVETYFSNGNV